MADTRISQILTGISCLRYRSLRRGAGHSLVHHYGYDLSSTEAILVPSFILSPDCIDLIDCHLENENGSTGFCTYFP